MSISSAAVRTDLLGAQNQPWRMGSLVSAGYHQRYEPGVSLERLPRSRAVMSGHLKESGFTGKGTTLHSVVRPIPFSLPTQRASGPLPKMTACGCSSRIKLYHAA